MNREDASEDMAPLVSGEGEPAGQAGVVAYSEVEGGAAPARPEFKRRAGFGFALILLILFHRLLSGSILHPGAIVNYGPPFNAGGDPKHQQYLNLIQTDVWQQFTIFEREQYQAARRGEFPTWNPNIYGGMPLHADAQSAFLNPFHW